MGNQLTQLTFDQWIRHVFDHEVTEPAWHFDLDADYWDGPPIVTVEYMTKLFRDPLPVVQDFSDAQLNQGLWYIASNACSNCMFALTDASVTMSGKIGCVRAIFPLYEQLFARRCSPHLGHRSEQGTYPLNSVCYMWWDLLPLTGAPDDRSRINFDAAVLEVMRQTLYLNSLACQEAALHGLGHWAWAYPDQVKRIIEQFIRDHPTLRQELRQYACAAQTGCIL